MGKYKIFVDTGADMPEETAKQNDIGIIRFLSVFGDESYVTGTEINNEEFYKKLNSYNGIPTTAQTPYGELYDILKEASLEYDTVIYFVLSSNASGQYNSACMVKNEILENDNPKADIRIFDTLRFSAFITGAAIYAKQLLDEGMNVDEVLDKSREYLESWEAYILVDTLKYLEKGGRITKTSAIVGSLLDIKPVLTIRNGLVEPVEKIRGRKKIYKKLTDLIKENPNFDKDSGEFMIVESNKEYAQEMFETLKAEFGISNVVYHIELGPVIGTHIGPGTIAVLFKLKKK